jgi:hypothetical protein
MTRREMAGKSVRMAAALWPRRHGCNVMAGHSPLKTGVNALLSRPSTPLLFTPPRKAWMPGMKPGMTEELSCRNIK